MNHLIIKNNQRVQVSSIPVLGYDLFLSHNTELVKNITNHCVNYFGYKNGEKVILTCCIANDETHEIYISSSIVEDKTELYSFSAISFAFEKFEREIHENFGIKFKDHPWLKQVRFPFNKFEENQTIADYPFFKMQSVETHEVGVGPIHAGVIEPGHFRFLCNGEQILHLEIQLGFQHRGIEQLILEKKKILQRTTIAESIAGDTVVGHTTAFVNLWESLCEYKAGEDLQYARTLALELERMAIHTGDLSAMCTDVAYQLGSSVLGRLRTPLINFFQTWCGNRLAKGLIRAGKSNYPFTKELASELKKVLDAYEPDFEEICKMIFHLPTVMARFEKTGEVKNDDLLAIGTVGMSARMNGISRDIRLSHPHDEYLKFEHMPVIKNHGDVFSRAQIRREEIRQSIQYIREMLENIPEENAEKLIFNNPLPESFAISLTEGWRGEICHCAITDSKSNLLIYKIKDPSFHNWLALELAVRNNEISDFPICNKSFDLSYCGHDL